MLVLTWRHPSTSTHTTVYPNNPSVLLLPTKRRFQIKLIIVTDREIDIVKNIIKREIMYPMTSRT